MLTHLRLLAEAECGLLDPAEATEWALQAIDKGVESASVVQIAGLSVSIETSQNLLRGLLQSAISGLERIPPDRAALLEQLVSYYASEVVNDRLPGTEAIIKIEKIALELGTPTSLDTFVVLAHETADSELLGIDQVALEREIKRACKEHLDKSGES